MRSLVLVSPAKLNLYLDVVGRRNDGYHDLVTLFERISLCDRLRLTVTSSPKIVVTSSCPDIPCGPENLAYKAADLMRRAYGIKKGLRIHIQKNIPVGAGLGGGSSNAATVLLGCQKLFRLGLSKKTLIDHANSLGSDVAFFILGKKYAIGRGRGGELTPLTGLDRSWWHVLFFPPLKVLTKDVYDLLDKVEKRSPRGGLAGSILALTKKAPNVNMLLPLLRKKDKFELDRKVYNRLSAIVLDSYSLVSELKSDLLNSGLDFVHMSGSGPTLFTVFGDARQARQVFRMAQRRFAHRCRVILAKTW
jgi:4-diphosphocytidyl-2-C-methyl-D-erythritol kinase